MTARREGWPGELTPLFEHAITVEYTSLTRTGRPIMVPVTPFVGSDGQTLDVSTGLTYPTKAERARNNPKVCLLYSVGSGLSDADAAHPRLDRAPTGGQPGPWLPAPADWRPAARRAMARLEHTDLAWVGTDGYVFRVQRVLADVSLQGNKIVRTLGFLGNIRRLRRRLEHEARRLGQPVPVVRRR